MSAWMFARVYLVASVGSGVLLFSATRVAGNATSKRLPADSSPVVTTVYRDGAAPMPPVAPPPAMESTPKLAGMLASVILSLQGAIVGFLIDFWNSYRDFLRNEPDWAGYGGGDDS